MNSTIELNPIQNSLVTPLASEPSTYSVAEAARVLGVSQVTIYRLIVRRVLRPLPHLRHKRIPKRQVSAYLNGASE